MKRGRGYLAFIDNGVDTVLNMAAFVLAYYPTAALAGPMVTLTDRGALLGLFFSVVLTSVIYQILGVNDQGRAPFRRGRTASAVPVANLCCLGVLSLAVTLLISSAEVERFVLLWAIMAFLISTAVIMLKRQTVVYIISALYRRGAAIKRVIVVSDSHTAIEALVRELGSPADSGAVLLGAVSDTDGQGACERLGGSSELSSVLERTSPDYAIFALESCPCEEIIRMVNVCDDACVKVYFLPTAHGYFRSARQVEEVGSLPLINVHSTPLDRPFNIFLKRAFDIAGSLLLILLSSPVMLLAAIGVKLSSRGPILFRQTRVGMLGRKFVMLKFRSMVVNSEENTAWSRGEDRRKTAFGNFLRRTSIDELPQLFNVLRGEMSLVGPRPELPVFVEKFKEEIPLYMIKHYAKPGMTGLAQIKGLRGDTSIEERIDADLYYIENWTPGLDISILLKTPFRAVNRREVYSGKREKREGKRILYAASSMGHIKNFHLPYINALRERGYDVRVMARGDGADYSVPFEKKLFSRKNARCRRQIRRIIKREKFDAVVLNTSLAAFHIRLSYPLWHRPRTVNFVHGYLFSQDMPRIKAWALLLCEIFLRGRTDTVITMNSDDLHTAKRYSLAPRVLFCRGVGAVIGPPREPSVIRRELGCDGVFALAFVGELSTRKNQEFLIRAMPRILSRIPEAELWLVGDGAERERLVCLSEELGVGGKVRFFGHRSEPWELMRACDLYVAPSVTEGLPRNLLEALGVGCTVLASAVKGHVDIISDGVDGFLYSFNDAEEFVNITCQIHDGRLRINKDAAAEKFRKYEFSRVFDDTLSKLLEGIG